MNSEKSSGNMDCIWMTSGLVKYKLCDKEFDCENCEFDKVFRNLSIGVNNNIKGVAADQNIDLLDRTIRRIESETYDNKVFYLKNQLVIKNLFGNAYYLGINPIVLYLLDDIEYIHEFNTNEIKKDQIIFTLESKWGVKQFISPINFMIIEKINFSQFKLNKWYSIILFNESDRDDYRISEEEWYRKKNSALNELRNLMADRPEIGQSMMDGGEKIKYLHQFIGGDNYLKLLDKIFM